MYRLLTYALVLLSLALAQGVLVGRASVVDGDTMEIQGVRVRLWGIDAVESSQTCLVPGGHDQGEEVGQHQQTGQKPPHMPFHLR
jgi:endonuclease YncB( thermonuclease family)